MGTVIGDWSKLGAFVRSARLEQGLTQAQLAERAAVARSWLAKVEAGHRNAELEPLFRLLTALGVEMTLSSGEEGRPATSQRPHEFVAAARRRRASWGLATSADGRRDD